MTEYLIAFNDEGCPTTRSRICARSPRLPSGTPLFTDGAVACGWPQEVRRFRAPMQLPEIS